MNWNQLLDVIKAHAGHDFFTLVEVREYGSGVQIALGTDGVFRLYYSRTNVSLLQHTMLPEEGTKNGVPDTVGYIVLDATHQTGVTWEMMRAIATQCIRPRMWRDRGREQIVFP